MNIKDDKELKFTIDKLIEYCSEIDEEIKTLSKKKKELEKIIKSYIFKTQLEQQNKKIEICYDSEFFNTYLNRKFKGKELYKIKKENFKEIIENKDYDNIEIKSSVELIRILIKRIDECKFEDERIRCEEILAKYLNYINRNKTESIKGEKDKDKIDLLNYLVNSNGKELMYVKGKKYVNDNYIDRNENISENDYMIKIIPKDYD